MINFANGSCLVEDIAELPSLKKPSRLYLDCETQSFDSTAKAVDVWNGHRVAGVAVTADNSKRAWYIPIRHTDARWNLPLDAVVDWIKDLVDTCGTWVNHNVKFDAHALARDGIEHKCELTCTLAGAKIVDSDRLTHAADPLCRDWFDLEDSYKDRVKSWLDSAKSKNYGDVPADILGEYACEDVLRCRMIDREITRRMPTECESIWAIERQVTSALYDMEERGMRVDLDECLRQEYLLTRRLLEIEQELHELADRVINPSSNDDCFDVLCNSFGLPVVNWTDSGNPSFDAAALTAYSAHPDVVTNPKLTKIVELMLSFRKDSTLLSLFVVPYQKQHADGVLHSDYNQIIRTGRMSSRRPNAQQLSKRAKKLIVPRGAFLSYDYSQMEFRLIVHYIKNLTAIAAYTADPDTDFHKWVADMCEIDRDPAKNVNFAMGYGAGRRKVLKMLASNTKLVKSLIADDPRALAARTMARAEEVYNRYHEELPELRRTSYTASRTAERYGYVFTAYGRRRHIPARRSHIAFNSVIQGTAADIMKERFVALSPRFNSHMRKLELFPVAVVHDEALLEDPSSETSRDPETVRYVAELLERTAVDFRVPIRVDAGWSNSTWADVISVPVPRRPRDGV